MDFAISQSVLYKDDPVISAQFATSIVKEVGNAVYGVIGEYLMRGLCRLARMRSRHLLMRTASK